MKCRNERQTCHRPSCWRPHRHLPYYACPIYITLNRMARVRVQVRGHGRPARQVRRPTGRGRRRPARTRVARAGHNAAMRNGRCAAPHCDARPPDVGLPFGKGRMPNALQSRPLRIGNLVPQTAACATAGRRAACGNAGERLPHAHVPRPRRSRVREMRQAP